MTVSPPSVPTGVEGAMEDGQGEESLSAPRGIELRGLTRIYGVQRALDRVDLHLPRGRSLALFGPNGAGKTTLLRLLSGELSPTEGAIHEDGVPLDTRSPQWRARIGVLSHQTFLYPQLTARENLHFFGRMYALDRLRDRLDPALEAVGLADRADLRVTAFSRGMRQRLALARTLLHDPSVVLLDEPFTGLDAHASGVLREALTRLRDGRRTVVMVTHNLTEGLRMADRVVIQVGGRIAWQGEATEVEEDFESFYRARVEDAA